MTKFIQLHSLISYPPSNLNRDDLGNPKTARIGGVERLRISSQSLKRAWRKSEIFDVFSENMGKRTRKLGVYVFEKLQNAKVEEADKKAWAIEIARYYIETEKQKKDRRKTDRWKLGELEVDNLVYISPEELLILDELIKKLIDEKREPKDEELAKLLCPQHAVDIAMFGRMLAGKPEWNTDAAVQVAHAFSVHASTPEEDYFTAVDDFKEEKSRKKELIEMGAAHIGQSGYAAAVFYQYICINRDLLKENLGENEELTQKALRTLVESVLTVAPSGKQNSYASRAYAHYALVEKGKKQPRSLALAFVKPIAGDDYISLSIDALENIRKNMDAVYGPCADSTQHFNVMKGEGSLQALLDFTAME